MRNFEDRMAEISRRSDQRIRERKNLRRRVLAACVPLVMCVFLGGAYLMGRGIEIGNGDIAVEDQAVAPENTAQDFLSSVTVEESFTYTVQQDRQAVEKVQRILEQIISSEITASHNQSDSQADRAGCLPDPYQEYSIRKEYSITCVDPQGNETSYLLSGMSLTDCRSGKIYGLTGKQRTDLLNALGIEEQKE